VAEMGDRLATVDMGPKVGGCCAPFRGGGYGSPSKTMWHGPRYTSLPSGTLIHPAVWHNRHRLELGGEAVSPFFGGGRARGAGSPSNTMWPASRPISVPSGILIHPTVWPQYTDVTDRIDNSPIAYGEPFYTRSPEKVKVKLK